MDNTLNNFRKYNMKLSIFVTTICALLFSCGQSECEKLNSDFSSYTNVISKIRSTDFQLEEKEYTDSSWIESIEYFSCDKNTGYLIITTKNGREYVHKDLPFQVWEGFKEAPSKGRYYNNFIKGNYHF